MGRGHHSCKRAWEWWQQEGCPCLLAAVALKPGLGDCPPLWLALGCRAREGVMKQDRLLFAFPHLWCPAVAVG